MEKAIIGIIGCGAIAQGTHLKNAYANPRIHVKWCCDLADENLRYVKDTYSCENLTKDYKEVLADDEVQGVLILTVHNVREEIIRAAAYAGKAIYVEKPMSLTPRESYDIMKIIKDTGVKFVVGFNRRCAPIVEDAKALLEDQKKNPKDAPWRYKRYGEAFKIPEEEATMMFIRINDDSASYKKYGLDEYVGQGSIIGEFCHFFDLACHIIGKEPVKIYTEGWARTNASVTVLFEDKSICTIFDASGGSFDHPKELFEIFYGGMSLQLDHFLQLRVGGREDIHKKNYDFIEDPYPYITEGEGTNLYINKMRERNRLNTDSTVLARSEVNKGHYDMLDRFVDCILHDAPSPCDVLDGARATLMCLKARESARLGLPVKISIDEYDYIIAD
ncbi:MAG: Gfo/Idh/MocA family oxidoreductase [Oscillospiraceae bacterium]|nr:Gfo/Idh/MocA family oxidoreductase [Oscillospiraceae bacterium]MBQ3225182.1 Gfo/Idh/MocA family oxidoreductase [Oscillospiraceae bacterium]MBQ6698410.1 Gfo/Idh/MocA family oxidoreductase [Oscillospiraceae bacterium]MBQ7053798.1 Gfo/Idh/MocA family oxidoreductase [Oscillospiraceae bacterium]